MLVLCDHEQATATLPADLEGVLSQQAGSARLALEHLEAEHPGLHPLLVTARTVAASEETLQASTVRRDLRPGPRKAAPRPPSAAPGPAATGSRGSPGSSRRARATCWSGPVGCSGEVGTPAPSPGWSTSPPRRPAPPSCRPAGGRCAPTCTGPRRSRSTWSVVCVSEEHPQGRQRLGPVRPQARRVLRRGRRGRGGRRRGACRRRPVAVRPAAGRRPSTPSTRGCWPARSSARRSGRRGPSARRTSTRSCTPCGSGRASPARRSWSRRPWCCAATTCGSATTGSRRGDRTSRSPSASCSRCWRSC